MGRTLALDYGRKRTGVAVTDELGMIATGLTTLRSADVITFLKEYVVKNTVDGFVVGEPRQMNNTPSEASVYIEPFVLLLKKTFPAIPVHRIDERFTSLIATRAIRDAGSKKKVRQDKALIDTVSATLILQSFLEAHPTPAHHP